MLSPTDMVSISRVILDYNEFKDNREKEKNKKSKKKDK
jgi:hypothetical protein